VQAESRRRAVEHLDTEIAYRIAVILLSVLLSLGNDRPEVNARRLKDQILIPRWCQRFRQYLECSANDPLCVARDNLYGLESFSSDAEMNTIVGKD